MTIWPFLVLFLPVTSVLDAILPAMVQCAVFCVQEEVLGW